MTFESFDASGLFNLSLTFQSLALPVSSMSKIAQIASIVRGGRGDLVSRAPWLMLATVSAARFYTVLVEAPDTESIHTHTHHNFKFFRL